MDANTLLERLKAYGADMHGIQDRFMGDAELYQTCFLSFLEEPNFGLLKRSMEEGAFNRAFDAAHALKGLSGNLGLSPFYQVLCKLVESLRAKEYENVREEYGDVQAAFERLEALLSDAPAEAPASAAETSAFAGAVPEKPEPVSLKRGHAALLDARWFSVAILGFMVVVVGAVCLMFFGLLSSYQISTDRESANHLTEINRQIELYIEGKIQNDWRTAYSVANALDQSALGDDITFALMREQQRVWEVSDIILYTESGYGISVDGRVFANDAASTVALRAKNNGEYLSIMESAVTYTVYLQTKQRIQGSRVVAVSVVQDVSAFLDNMDFSSFDGAAYMYLTQADGTVISRLTHKDCVPAYNFMSLLDERELTPLTRGGAYSKERLLASADAETYLMHTVPDETYIVSSPIETRHDALRLFYLVPENVVNHTMNSFYRYVVTLCVTMIVVFAAVMLLVFMLIYQNRKKRFNKAIFDRERMLDLLVQNTDNAFALLTLRQREPVYYTSNIAAITGFPYLCLEKLDVGYRLTASTGEEPAFLADANHKLAEWDGKREFVSDSIQTAQSGRVRYHELHVYPAANDGEEFVGSIQDVTLAHERENVVREALTMAERANEAKDRFLANMSHDIRTPMNAIINMTNFALNSMGDPMKQTEYLRQVRKSSDHLLGLINDVLDMSRIESGQTIIGSEPFNILAVIDNACSIIRPLAADKQQVFIMECSGVQTADVLGDQLKVSRVLINLLSNAVKFTPAKGAIRFTATELPSLAQDMVDIRFVVEDNGVGISPELLERIFEPFVRANDGSIGGAEGTGLGLPICKSYVNAMGGTLTVKSEVQNGSTFTVELFFRRVLTEEKQAERVAQWGERPFDGKRCLLCEDNDVNRLIGHTILQNIGFTVDEAEDGRVGATRFITSKPDTYDVIYMDIQMPEMDGYEATVAIRESEHPQAKTVPIIAMTANVFAEDIEKARLAGMNGYVGKPIMTLALIDESYRVLTDGGREK